MPDAFPTVPAGALPRVRWWWLLLPVLALALARDLWAPDEPRYAEVAREACMPGGDLLVMHRSGELYPDKPPLLFWLAGLLGRLSGWHAGAMRLVSVLATGATAWIVARTGRRAWGRFEGDVAAAAFLSCIMVTQLGGRLQIDPLLALLATGALALLWRPAASAREAGRAAVQAGALVGLGVLAKGPVAFVLVGLPWLAARLALGSDGAARAPRAARAIGWALAILLPAAWAASAVARAPELLDALLYEQHVGKALDGSRHPGPFWKHLVNLPAFLLPWTLPAALGLREAWRALRRPRAARGPGEAELVRCGLWLAVLVLFFSCLVSKRDLYLLPAYPAAALLVGRALGRAARERGAARATGWCVCGLLGLLALGLAGAAVAAPLAPALEEYRALAPGAALSALALGLAAVSLARAVQSGPAERWLARACPAQGLSVAVALVLLLPPLDAFKSPRPLAERLLARPERPARIPCIGVHPDGFRFYGAPTVFGDALEPALAEEGADFLALVRDRDWEGLPAGVRARLAVVDRERVGSRRIYVVALADASRPASGG